MEIVWVGFRDDAAEKLGQMTGCKAAVLLGFGG
jgi:hypothetical protein